MGRRKGIKDKDKICINPTIFRRILHSNNISIRSLGTQGREHYIGWSDKSIYRAVKTGVMSIGLYDALMKEIDISPAIVNSDSYLIKRVSALEEELKLLNERVHRIEIEFNI